MILPNVIKVKGNIFLISSLLMAFNKTIQRDFNLLFSTCKKGVGCTYFFMQLPYLWNNISYTHMHRCSSVTVYRCQISSFLGGVAPPCDEGCPPFYRAAIHKKDKSWVPLGTACM